MRSLSNELKVVMNDLKKEPLRDSRVFFFLRTYLLTLSPLVVLLCLFAHYQSYLAYWVILFLVTGFTQNAMGILMHEGSHYFFARSKRTNDFIANTFVCYVLMNTVDAYRKEHLYHHKFAGNAQDPYAGIYDVKSKKEFLRKLFFDFTLLTTVEKFIIRYLKPGPALLQHDEKLKRDYRGLLGVAISNGLLFLLYFYITGSIFGYFVFWILPLMTIPTVINRIRTFVEHYTGGEEEANRSVAPNIFERVLIAPYGYSFHFIHHTAAGIPYYFLQKSHKKLLKLGVVFEDTEIAKSYMGTFFKLYKTLPDK